MGGALALKAESFAFGPWLAALGVAFLLQIGSNLANDVYDNERGTDTADRKGPTRVTQAGLIKPAVVKLAMAAALGAAFLLGVYLTFVGGWVIMAVGLAAIASAVAYTGGPYPLGYHGLGEIFVFIFFGLASVVGTYYVSAGSVSGISWLMAIPVGLIITALLIVNNLRDINEDRIAKKRTMAVRLGTGFTRFEYSACLGLAYCVPVALIALGKLPVWSLSVFLSIPFAAGAMKIVLSEEGRLLNKALALTGQTAFFYSVFFAAGLLVK